MTVILTNSPTKLSNGVVINHLKVMAEGSAFGEPDDLAQVDWPEVNRFNGLVIEGMRRMGRPPQEWYLMAVAAHYAGLVPWIATPAYQGLILISDSHGLRPLGTLLDGSLP